MVTLAPRGVALAWFRRDDYPRIREVCDDDLPATFDEWQEMVERRLKQPPANTLTLEKVIIDPDGLVAFARKLPGAKIDAAVRSQYAAFLLMQKHGRDH